MRKDTLADMWLFCHHPQYPLEAAVCFPKVYADVRVHLPLARTIQRHATGGHLAVSHSNLDLVLVKQHDN